MSRKRPLPAAVDDLKLEVHIGDVPNKASWYPAECIGQQCAGWLQVRLANGELLWVPCVAVRYVPETPASWKPVGDAQIELWYEHAGLAGWWQCDMLSTMSSEFYEVLYTPTGAKHRATQERLRPVTVRCGSDPLPHDHRDLLPKPREPHMKKSLKVKTFAPIEGDPADGWPSKYSPPIGFKADVGAKSTQLLAFACSPKIAPLKNVQSEAIRIAAATWGAGVSIQHGGTPEQLHALLAQGSTKRFLFIGHADAELCEGQRTLGCAATCDRQPPKEVYERVSSVDSRCAQLHRSDERRARGGCARGARPGPREVAARAHLPQRLQFRGTRQGHSRSIESSSRRRGLELAL